MPLTLSDTHQVIRLLSNFVKLKKNLHCAWCGKEFEAVVALGNTPPTYCGDTHASASRKARRKRKELLEQEALVREAPRFHSDDPLAAAYRIPFLSMNRAFPKNARCHYCNGIAVTRDHVVPRSKGGPNNYWNLVPACEPCNTRKDSRLRYCKCEYCERASELTKSTRSVVK